MSHYRGRSRTSLPMLSAGGLVVGTTEDPPSCWTTAPRNGVVNVTLSDGRTYMADVNESGEVWLGGRVICRVEMP